jgi:hypothetical protein
MHKPKRIHTAHLTRNTPKVLSLFFQGIFLISCASFTVACGFQEPPSDSSLDRQIEETSIDEQEDHRALPFTDAPHKVVSASEGLCGIEEADCESLSCCDGLFCSNEINVYSEPVCIPEQEDGSFCWTDEQCESECLDGICGGQQCIQEDEEGCGESADCCEGSFCSTELLLGHHTTYCTAPLENGDQCTLAEHCQSGYCADNICADEPNQCISEDNNGCFWNGDCCEGLVCLWSINNGYMPGACVQPLSDGEFCVENSQCDSDTCEDGVCGGPVCHHAGDSCVDAECCDGSFCSSEISPYTEPSCTAPLENESYCVSNTHCESGICENSVCVAEEAECLAQNVNCEAGGAPCCDGICLHFGYGFGSCADYVENGGFCTEDTECASASCIDGLCS